MGNRTTWAYDAADRVTTTVDALGTTTFAYDAADQLTAKTDRNSRQTTFAYDGAGNQTQERWFNGGSVLRTVTYTYDAVNRLTGAVDPDATLTFTYDAKGRQLTAATSSAAGQPSVTLTSTYNESDDRVSLTDNLSSVGRTTYSYDSAHRLTTIARSLGGTAGPRVAMGYDAGNRMTSIERTINGADPKVLTTLSYDAANRVTTITHAKATYNFFPPGYVTTPLATYTYGYDDANRVTSETNAEGSVTYAYDSTSQLTTVSGARSESYSYDLNGNRTMTGYTTGAGNQLSAGAGFTFTYDSEGNMTGRTETATGKVTTFAYDHRNRMTGATTKDSGGSVIMLATYTYDALGRRIGTNVDADGAGAGSAVQAWMVYDGVNTYADFDSAGTLKMRYLHGLAVDELLARTDSGGATAWYLTDKLGTVRDVVNASGVVIYHAAYDGYGKTTSETGSGGDRFRFTRREFDSETSLQYNRARMYDSATGRWTGLDPISFGGGQTNIYGYVGNGPLNYVDTSGMRAGPPSGFPNAPVNALPIRNPAQTIVLMGPPHVGREELDYHQPNDSGVYPYFGTPALHGGLGMPAGNIYPFNGMRPIATPILGLGPSFVWRRPGGSKMPTFLEQIRTIRERFPNGIPAGWDVVLYTHSSPGKLMMASYFDDALKVTNETLSLKENHSLFLLAMKPLFANSPPLYIVGCDNICRIDSLNVFRTSQGAFFIQTISNGLNTNVSGTVGLTTQTGPLRTKDPTGLLIVPFFPGSQPKSP